MVGLKINRHCEQLKGCGNMIEHQPLRLMMGSVTNVLNNESLQAALQDKKLQALLYQELKIIAHAKLRKHVNNKDLDTTSLVHEAYLKLSVNSDEKKWSNRRHFYSTAALSMRHILVDMARRQMSDKRGAANQQVTYEEQSTKTAQDCFQVVALNEALEQLKDVDPNLVEVVHLRYFVGMTVSETAEILGVSKRTLDRTWQKAKAILAALIDE